MVDATVGFGAPSAAPPRSPRRCACARETGFGRRIQVGQMAEPVEDLVTKALDGNDLDNELIGRPHVERHKTITRIERDPRADIEARNSPPVPSRLTLSMYEVHGLRRTFAVAQRRLPYQRTCPDRPSSEGRSRHRQSRRGAAPSLLTVGSRQDSTHEPRGARKTSTTGLAGGDSDTAPPREVWQTISCHAQRPR